MRLLRAVADRAEAHRLRKPGERLQRGLGRIARHEDVRGVVEQAGLARLKAAALLARHRVAAHVNEAVRGRKRRKPVAHAALDAAHVRHDAAGPEVRSVVPHERDRVLRVQADVDDVRLAERRGAADAVDRAEGERVQQDVFVAVKADDGVRRIGLERLCDGPADEAEPDDCDSHGKTTFPFPPGARRACASAPRHESAARASAVWP